MPDDLINLEKVRSGRFGLLNTLRPLETFAKRPLLPNFVVRLKF
jgi:hypothetical protein